MAEYAIGRAIRDLEGLNERHIDENGRVVFTTVQGRVKEEASFLKKLHETSRDLSQTRGFSRTTLESAYEGIKDLAGVRFACPYFDEVVPAVDDVVRPRLAALGYATDLRGEAATQDKDFLQEGDPFGYRSYHFFIRVPTVVDIFGTVETCLCEVQARSELQHVWADKSHDLLYKRGAGWKDSEGRVIALMKAVSDDLRAVDEYLVDIRRRVREEGDHE